MGTGGRSLRNTYIAAASRPHLVLHVQASNWPGITLFDINRDYHFSKIKSFSRPPPLFMEESGATKQTTCRISDSKPYYNTSGRGLDKNGTFSTRLGIWIQTEIDLLSTIITQGNRLLPSRSLLLRSKCKKTYPGGRRYRADRRRRVCRLPQAKWLSLAGWMWWVAQAAKVRRGVVVAGGRGGVVAARTVPTAAIRVWIWSTRVSLLLSAIYGRNERLVGNKPARPSSTHKRIEKGQPQPTGPWYPSVQNQDHRPNVYLSLSLEENPAKPIWRFKRP
jgi:hypothetical protein